LDHIWVMTISYVPNVEGPQPTGMAASIGSNRWGVVCPNPHACITAFPFPTEALFGFFVGCDDWPPSCGRLPWAFAPIVFIGALPVALGAALGVVEICTGDDDEPAPLLPAAAAGSVTTGAGTGSSLSIDSSRTGVDASGPVVSLTGG
jgi:hypothetical protein